MDNYKDFDPEKEKFKHIILLMLSITILIWSAINPYRYSSWLSLVIPPFLLGLILVCTYNRFQFTTLTYFMVFVHIAILLIGAKYTYTQNPVFLELKEIFDLSRNHFDRIGHFAQGFIPIFLVKEFLLRKGYMKRSKMFYLIILAFILAISAFYEILEFAVTIITGKTAEDILALQGDQWDTHWDMILALLGATSSLLLFGKLHDRMMKEMK